MVIGKAAFIAAVILQIVIRYPYRKETKRTGTDAQERVLLLLFSIGGLLLPLIYSFTNWLAFADYDAPGWVIGAGIVVMVVALWLFWRAHADLGRNWSASLEIYNEHALVTQGVYERIRHPMYLAGWLIVVGQALLLSNWVAGLSGLITFGLLYFLRVPKEEQMMLAEFGEPYQQYIAATGRILPKWG